MSERSTEKHPGPFVTGNILGNGTAPPSSPLEGDSYVVKPAATGAWEGQGSKVATFVQGRWQFATPRDNDRVYDSIAKIPCLFAGDAWYLIYTYRVNLPLVSNITLNPGALLYGYQYPGYGNGKATPGTAMWITGYGYCLEAEPNADIGMAVGVYDRTNDTYYMIETLVIPRGTTVKKAAWTTDDEPFAKITGEEFEPLPYYHNVGSDALKNEPQTVWFGGSVVKKIE